MMKTMNGQTGIYGIIGQPIAHSLSPLFQNWFIENAKQNACYLPFLVEPENLKVALQGLHAAHIQGLNVTVPHKENILPWVNADADAQAIGAVNTLKRLPSGWQATNTDWQGFASVIQGLEVNVSQTSALLFGAGGTSRAILHALHHHGAKEVYICNRNQDRAKQLITSLVSTYPDMQMHILEWDNEAVGNISQEAKLIINSTSIGLKDGDVFPFQLLGSGVAIDAVYKPSGNTVFCAAASNYRTVDGLPMLIAQGIASFAFWHTEKLQAKALNLPNSLESLQWVEKQLSREPLSLPSWRLNT
jgi:shikimate dehydrogenase